MNSKRLSNPFAIMWCLIAAALLLVPALALGQIKDADPFLGNFKGTAKMNGAETSVTLELKIVEGKFAGHAVAADGDYKVASGKIANGTLTIMQNPSSLVINVNNASRPYGAANPNFSGSVNGVLPGDNVIVPAGDPLPFVTPFCPWGS